MAEWLKEVELQSAHRPFHIQMFIKVLPNNSQNSKHLFFRPTASNARNDSDQLPWYWPKEVSLEGGRIDLDPKKKLEISRQFTLSLGQQVDVLDVEEVCNAEFHMKYEKYIFFF